jgi:PAS domain S-box-containing protein
MAVCAGSLIELLPDPILLVGRDGGILDVNHAFEKELGWRRTELAERPLTDIVATPPDELSAYLRRCAGSLQSAVPGAAVFRTSEGGTIRLRCDGGSSLTEDGQPGPILLRCRPHRLAVTEFTVISDKVKQLSHEIMRRKQIEDELRESERRFRALADNLPLLCWIANADGWVVWYNFRWYEYTGTTPEQMAGWGWQSVHDPKELPGVVAAWKHSLTRGEPFEMVFPLRGADGTFRPFLTRVVPIRDSEGRITRWFGTNTEVRDIMEAREALQRSRAELEQLVEQRTAALLHAAEERRRAEEALRQAEKLAALGQLTGGVAHDFNNLLQVVTSGAALLKRPTLPETRKAEILDSMIQAGKTARELTGRLLTFARQQRLRPEVLDLGGRLASMSELLSQTLGSRIRIETEIEPGLWPVRVDPSQLEVAILNLAVNARDAMPDGGTLTFRAHNIRMEATKERAVGEYACIVVQDTGAGIPQHIRTRVLEPFFTTKERGQGTGLGLSQVHGFVKQSGGDLQIQSEPGRGTAVHLHLPRAAADAEVILLPEAKRPDVLQGMGKTVLVVEDNPDVAAFACTILEELGYVTRRAGTAVEALTVLAASDPIHAVFSDVVMPGGISGVELAAELRSSHPHVALVLATGYSEQLAREGVPKDTETLAKPYHPDELAAALARALTRSKNTREVA